MKNPIENREMWKMYHLEQIVVFKGFCCVLQGEINI